MPDTATTRTYEIECPDGCHKQVVCIPGDVLPETMKCNDHNAPLTVVAVNGERVNGDDNRGA